MRSSPCQATVAYRLLEILLCGSHQHTGLYCKTTHTHTGLACCSSPSFHWYSQHLPTEGWPGWVDLCSWLHSHFPSLPIVMHLSTNHTQSWSASDVEFLECFWNYSEKIVMSPGSTKSNFVDQDQNVAIRPRCLIFTYHMAHNTVNIHETSSSTV